MGNPEKELNKGGNENGNPQANGAKAEDEKKGLFSRIGTAGKIILGVVVTAAVGAAVMAVKAVLGKEDAEEETGENQETSEPSEE